MTPGSNSTHSLCMGCKLTLAVAALLFTNVILDVTKRVQVESYMTILCLKCCTASVLCLGAQGSCCLWCLPEVVAFMAMRVHFAANSLWGYCTAIWQASQVVTTTQ